jgi:hypothetical protein
MKYSVLLPTYNERENLPLMISMLNGVFEAEYVGPVSSSVVDLLFIFDDIEI